MKTKLLAFNNSWSPGLPEHDWNIGYVIAPDGSVIAAHCSSSNSFLKADLGFSLDENGEAITGPGQANRAKFAQLYPDGFEVEWVEDARKTSCGEEFARRMELNAKLCEQLKNEH